MPRRFRLCGQDGGYGGDSRHKRFQCQRLAWQRGSGVSECEYDVFFSSKSPEVEYGVSHSAERRVDAHSGELGDLLEREVLVVAHVEHLSLQVRKLADEIFHVFLDLGGDDHVFYGLFAKFLAVEHVDVIEVGTLHVFRFLLAVVVDDQIVGYTRDPCRKFPRFRVAPLLDRQDRLYEGVLEDIVGHILVLYDPQDVVVYPLLMAFEQYVKSLVAALRVSLDQLFIGHA